MHELLRTLIKQFMPYAKEKIGFKHPPRLFLRQDAKNAANPLGKTAFYDPQAKSVTIYTTNRHPKDVMRSLSHELVHHKQNCDGQFDHVGEMGEGYAQNDDHLRGMEREAYEVGNLCFRDWEDSIKGTIYNEHLLKGVNNTMSTKTWKNKELTTLLSEAWGFGFDLDHLGEGIEHLEAWKKKQNGDKDDDDSDKDDEDDDDDEKETKSEGFAGGQMALLKKAQEQRAKEKKEKEAAAAAGGEAVEEEEPELEEAFERPKSALGAGPTNKGGKVERSDVANKDTSKFGQGGSKGGGKESAGGSVSAPKAGKIDRSDVANKASGRWLKENEEEGETLDEMCPGADEGHEHGMGMEKVSYEGPEGRASELIDELKELIMQMQGGGMVPGNRAYQEGEEAEELEERHKPPNVTQGRDSARRLKKASGERIEEQVRRLIRKSLKNVQAKKKK